MSKFDLKSILSSSSLQAITQEAQKEQKTAKSNIEYISVHDLIPSEENFYSMEQINELKIAIELAGGVKQNLIVVPLENGKYKVIAGHRRCTAAWELSVNEGKTEYEYLPCSIEHTVEDAKVQALKEELLIILLNSQREKTEYDKVQEVERLKAVLEKYRESETIPGRTRKLIAQILNTSTSQVERREKIAKGLTPEFKKELKEQKVNASTALELAKLSPEEQQQIYKEYTDKGSITVKEVQKIKTDTEKSTPTIITKTTITEEVQQKELETVPVTKAKNIYVCSPYGGLSENYRNAVEYCKYVAIEGHIPYASHVMLHGILQDDVYDQRLKGLQAGCEMLKICDEVWVFIVDGEVTKDMFQEIEVAKQMGKTIIYRRDYNVSAIGSKESQNS